MANEADLEEEKRALSEENLLQLHGILMEGIGGIIAYIRTLCDSRPMPTDAVGYRVMLAAVRVFGAWLAEDSLSLTSEIHSVLPPLLRLCEHVLECGEDIFKFLLPGLSNLISGGGAERLLEDTNLLQALLKYFLYWYAGYLHCTVDILV